MTEAPFPIIRLENISKSFGPVHANRDITLDIHLGKIKALLGENGAGKSTLMSILAGRIQPDRGRIRVNGAPSVFASTRAAIVAGIGMVYQHFMLVEAMTVAENVFLGQEKEFWIKPKRRRDRVRDLAESFGLPIDPDARISRLSMGEKQRVEILKLLLRESRILIFDEPTAVLTPRETDRLFSAMRRMADAGKAIIFISHKLSEVMDIADDIAILRNGRLMDRVDTRSVGSQADLARRMVGRDVMLTVSRDPVEKGPSILQVKGLKTDELDNVTFHLRQGEILAVVGVAGNGQKPLVETICGLATPTGGSVEILGTQGRGFFARHPSGASLSYIPEDRLGMATCPGLNLSDNFLLTNRREFSRGIWLKHRQAEETASGLMRRFGVQPLNVKILARQLSGGNLQKMVLGRELYRNPRLIIAEQPTQGLDVTATEEVWIRLLEARKTAGILLVTGDLPEALALADRIAVMFRGRMMDIFDSSERRKVEQIGLLMAGIAPNP